MHQIMASTSTMPPQKQHRKRSSAHHPDAASSSAEGESKRGKFDDVMEEDNDDSNFTLVDLHRLVHVMETDPSPSFASWRDIHRRADLCQQMYVALVGQSNGAAVGMLAGDVQRFKARVDAVCMRAVEVVIELKALEESQSTSAAAGAGVAGSAGAGTNGRSGRGKGDLVQEIFFPKRANAKAAVSNSNSLSEKMPAPSRDKESTMKGERFDIKAKKVSVRTPPKASAPASAAAKSASKTDTAVADLQEQQREQMEEALSGLAGQLKQHTSQIHSQLRGQTEHLSDMETIAEQNVEAVTDVANATQQHVQRGWRRSVATWTLLITVAVAFCATLLTIFTIPKRVVRYNQASSSSRFCIGWLCLPSPTANQFCRTLPNGQQECVDAPPSKADPAVDDGETKETSSKTVDEEQDEANQEGHDDHQTDDYQTDDTDDNEDEEDRDETEYSDQDETLYLAASRAAMAGDVAQLQAYLEEDPSLVSAHDDNGWTLLHESASMGLTDVVQLLLDFGCDADLRVIETDQSALDLIVERGELAPDHPTIVLLQQHLGMEVVESEAASQDDDNESNSNNEQECEVGPNGECVTQSQDEPKPVAAATHQDATASPRQESTSSSSNNEENKADSPPTFDGRPFMHHELLRAVQRGDVRRLQGYLEAKPPFLDEADNNGWTVLHLAIRSGNLDLIQVLLDGGSSTTATTLNGQTALDLATHFHGRDTPAVVDLVRRYI